MLTGTKNMFCLLRSFEGTFVVSLMNFKYCNKDMFTLTSYPYNKLSAANFLACRNTGYIVHESLIQKEFLICKLPIAEQFTLSWHLWDVMLCQTPISTTFIYVYVITFSSFAFCNISSSVNFLSFSLSDSSSCFNLSSTACFSATRAVTQRYMSWNSLSSEIIDIY